MPTTPTSETANATATSAVERARQIAEPLAASLGLELVEVEYLREGRRWVLRLYVDKAGGVTLDDCTGLSHALGPALDVEDFPPGQAKGAGGPTYALEVSSPGIERPLRKPADFRRFAGKKAQVKTYAKIAPEGGLPGRRSFSGTLLGCDGVCIEIDVDGTRCAIPLGAIAKANLLDEAEGHSS